MAGAFFLGRGLCGGVEHGFDSLGPVHGLRYRGEAGGVKVGPDFRIAMQAVDHIKFGKRMRKAYLVATGLQGW